MLLELLGACLSLPVVVGKEGIARVIEPELGNNEVEAFRQCTTIVRQGIEISLAS